MAETQNDSYIIRFALESDAGIILQLIRELAIYERALDSVNATEAKLRSTLSFPKSAGSSDFTPGYARTLLVAPAKAPSDIAGMAMYFHNYSTWHAAPGIYLEDLFVSEHHRARGYGKALLQALARECVRLDCKRLEWSVLKWNKPSIDFYVSETVGAEIMEEWQGCRVDGERLMKLAGAK